MKTRSCSEFEKIKLIEFGLKSCINGGRAFMQISECLQWSIKKAKKKSPPYFKVLYAYVEIVLIFESKIFKMEKKVTLIEDKIKEFFENFEKVPSDERSAFLNLLINEIAGLTEKAAFSTDNFKFYSEALIICS